MYAEMIKTILLNAIRKVAEDKEGIVEDAKKMFIRKRKITFETLIQGSIAMGSGKTMNEIIDYFKGSDDIPTESAWIQQKNKIKPEAIRRVLLHFQAQMEKTYQEEAYRYLAVDGSTVTYFSNEKFSNESYYYNPGTSAKGAYSIHVNALYDLTHPAYVDALLQPIRQKDEFSAFCALVDRQKSDSNAKYIYIGDRGFCSFNCMAHVIENGQYFLFRTKDITSKGMARNLIHPDTDSFDTKQTVTLVRHHSKQWKDNPNVHFLDPDARFDYIQKGYKDEYTFSFRLVRFPISEDSYECIVTNLPEDEFPTERMKALYNMRWGIETSFRQLKHTIGLVYTHSYKPQGIMIEIYARMVLFNFSSACTECVTLEDKKGRKYKYKSNFSTAVHNCRQFLSLVPAISLKCLTSLLKSLLIPIRENRSYPRLQTAHFRKPHRSNYRPS